MIPFKHYILPVVHCDIRDSTLTEAISTIYDASDDVVQNPHDDKMDLDLHQQLRFHYAGLSPQHKNQIQRYTQHHLDEPVVDSFRHINDRLINGKVLSSELGKIAVMDDALNTHRTPKPFVVYSGIGEQKHTQTIMSNDKVRHPGYLSTSFLPQIARAFAKDPLSGEITAQSREKDMDPDRKYNFHMLKIHVPQNHPGTYIEHFTKAPGEHEFILPRDTILRIDHSKRESKDFGQRSKLHIHHATVMP